MTAPFVLQVGFSLSIKADVKISNTVTAAPLMRVVCSALTFRDFIPRLELWTLFRDFLGIFGKVHKCLNYFSLFFKPYLVHF